MEGTRRHLENDLESWRIIEDIQVKTESGAGCGGHGGGADRERRGAGRARRAQWRLQWRGAGAAAGSSAKGGGGIDPTAAARPHIDPARERPRAPVPRAAGASIRRRRHDLTLIRRGIQCQGRRGHRSDGGGTTSHRSGVGGPFRRGSSDGATTASIRRRRPVPAWICHLYLPLSSPSTSPPCPAARRRRRSGGGGATSRRSASVAHPGVDPAGTRRQHGSGGGGLSPCGSGADNDG
uniref:Uncharacterized protein n=1 Tax=Oryza sativa subsp. japonica TaxID=39947 RepID=Q6K367_ORYSJ|nr:hypothetical protein [Oryza sativa Japonica Group]BAD22451.1 hypothetical protein [Oryza sativa Japonica Group]